MRRGSWANTGDDGAPMEADRGRMPRDRGRGWRDEAAGRLRLAVTATAGLVAGVGIAVVAARPSAWPAAVVTTVAAAVMVALVRGHLPVDRRAMDLAGGLLGTVTNAVVVALTGGATSPFVPLFGVTPLVAATTPLSVPLVAMNLALAVGGIFSPYLYDDVPSWFLLQGLGHAAMWTVATGAVLAVVTRLNRRGAELEDADRLRMMFLRAISHELRRPLTVLRGNVELLRARGDQLDREARAELYAALDRQSGRLDRLLHDLLDVDRLERGAEVLDRVPVRLDDLVAGIVKYVEPDEHHVELGDLDSVVVSADRPKLERVVENLLVNALRHTPAGTRVRLSVRSGSSGWGLVVVEDDGPGVPRDLREDVFHPFVRGPAVDGEGPPGTGVGLNLVRQLVRLHGGDVTVDDSPDLGGARFTVRLPG